MKDEEIKKIGYEKHSKWKNTMLLLQTKKVNENDALLVLNYEKNDLSNYIGGATFLEIFQAFQQNKKIFLMNPIPEGILKDELIGMNPIIINQNLNLIK